MKKKNCLLWHLFYQNFACGSFFLLLHAEQICIKISPCQVIFRQEVSWKQKFWKNRRKQKFWKTISIHNYFYIHDISSEFSNFWVNKYLIERFRGIINCPYVRGISQLSFISELYLHKSIYSHRMSSKVFSCVWNISERIKNFQEMISLNSQISPTCY